MGAKELEEFNLNLMGEDFTLQSVDDNWDT